MAAAIEFKGADKWFGRLHVLVDVDLGVDAGEVIVVSARPAPARAR